MVMSLNQLLKKVEQNYLNNQLLKKVMCCEEQNYLNQFNFYNFLEKVCDAKSKTYLLFYYN